MAAEKKTKDQLLKELKKLHQEKEKLENLVEKSKFAAQKQQNILMQMVVERESKEEQLSLFMKFVETSGEGMGWADLDGSVKYLNPALCHMLDLENRADFYGKSVTQFYDEETQRKLVEEIFPRVLSEGFWTGDMVLHSIKGKTTPTMNSLFVLRDAAGNPISFANVVTDLTERRKNEEVLKRHRDQLEIVVAQRTENLSKTNQELQQEIAERKQVEDALRLSEQKFFKAFHSNPSMMSISTLAEGQFIEVNDTFTRLTGYNREEIIGQTALQLRLYAHPEDRDKIKRMLSEHKSFQNIDVRIRTKSGEERTVLFSAEVIAESEEKFMIVTAEDITARKLAEKELKKYRDHLEELVRARTSELENAQRELVRKEKLSALGQLTASVGHEIRNPLGTIRTNMFTINDAIERDEPERVRRAIQIAERNIDRCDMIITELLDFSRKRILNVQKTDIDDWLSQVMKEMVIPDGIEYHEDFSSHAVIPVDRENLRRVVINILHNAIQAMQEQTVTTKKLTMKTTVQNNRLEIHVSDTGPGIDTDDLDKIFEPLFSTKSSGFGLGLPIVKDIMDEHGGGITIHSEQASGTTASLWFPLDSFS